MFDLTEAILERIIFAMEDQSKSYAINLDTGELQPRPDQDMPDNLALPPDWTSEDGFKILETFALRTTNIVVKKALQKILGRGKGVFKSYKALLAEFPEEETRFRLYKQAVMKRKIESWLDDQREIAGLARLGSEPEEFDELSDFEFQLESFTIHAAMAECSAFLESFFLDEIPGLPREILAYEKSEVAEFMKNHEHAIQAFAFRGAEGELIALLLALPVPANTQPLGLVRFVGALRDFRGMGLELRLLEEAKKRLKKEKIESLLISSLALDAETAGTLPANGFTAVASAFRSNT